MFLIKPLSRLNTKKTIIIMLIMSMAALMSYLLYVSSNASALFAPWIYVQAQPGSYSVDAYPNNKISVEIGYSPEADDFYKDIYIIPFVSAYDPGHPSFNESDWADDIDFLSEAQVVQPTSYDTIFLTFNQQLITRGSNYIGCLVVREDFDPENVVEGSYSLCNDNSRVIYSGSMLPVWRFYNKKYSSHFMTISHNEKMSLINNDPSWKYEKPAFMGYSQQSGLTGNIALYRFWSKTMKTHFYTASSTERDAVIKNYSDDVWKYEKIAFYVQPYKGGCKNGSKPVFRFWSKLNKSHFYTISTTERDQVIKNYSDDEWRYEGPKFCAW